MFGVEISYTHHNCASRWSTTVEGISIWYPPPTLGQIRLVKLIHFDMPNSCGSRWSTTVGPQTCTLLPHSVFTAMHAAKVSCLSVPWTLPALICARASSPRVAWWWSSTRMFQWSEQFACNLSLINSLKTRLNKKNNKHSFHPSSQAPAHARAPPGPEILKRYSHRHLKINVFVCLLFCPFI